MPDRWSGRGRISSLPLTSTIPAKALPGEAFARVAITLNGVAFAMIVDTGASDKPRTHAVALLGDVGSTLGLNATCSN